METFEFYPQVETARGWRKMPEQETDTDGMFAHHTSDSSVEAVGALIATYETIMHKGIGWNPFIRDHVRWILKHNGRVVGMITDSEKPKPVLEEKYLWAADDAFLESGMYDCKSEKYFIVGIPR